MEERKDIPLVFEHLHQTYPYRENKRAQRKAQQEKEANVQRMTDQVEERYKQNISDGTIDTKNAPLRKDKTRKEFRSVKFYR